MGSPGSRAKCIRTCVGSLTAQGSATSCHGDASDIAFRLSPGRRHPEVTRLVAGHQFRSSIPSLHVPLSTLPLRPYGRRCMTRGQCGWLNIHCMKLPFTTLCRFNRRTEIAMKVTPFLAGLGATICMSACAGLTQMQDTAAKFDQGVHAATAAELSLFSQVQAAECSRNFYSKGFDFATAQPDLKTGKFPQEPTLDLRPSACIHFELRSEERRVGK